MEKFFTIFDKNFVVIAFCLLFVLIAVAIDLYNGVRKAKKNGIARISEGYRRTAEKLKTYYSLMFLCICADFILCYVILEYNNFIPTIPYITLIITIWFLFTEWKSVHESADIKLKKQINQSGADLLTFVSKLKDKDIQDLLEKLKTKQES